MSNHAFFFPSQPIEPEVVVLLEKRKQVLRVINLLYDKLRFFNVLLL
jgi:hypothetical protein